MQSKVTQKTIRKHKQQQNLKKMQEFANKNEVTPKKIREHKQHQNLKKMQNFADKNQVTPQKIREHKQHQNLKKMQNFADKNQVTPECLRKYKQQIMKPGILCAPGKLPLTEGQVSFQNQMSPQPLQKHLQHQNLRSLQPGTLCPLVQLSATDVQIFFPNQESLRGNSMSGVSQDPQHQTNQATLSIPKDAPSSEAVVDMLPTSALTQQQSHQHIQQQLPPESPSPIFLQLLSQSLMSKHTVINQKEKPSSQMSVVHQPSEPNLDQISEEVMRHYASTFREKRRMLGVSQDYVALELFQMYKKKVSPKQIDHFENFKLSLKTMCDLKWLLDQWLANIEASLRICQLLNSTDCTNIRKMNIIIPTTTRHILEKAFLQDPNPAVEKTEKLVKELAVDNESVRIWFSNRSEVPNRIQSLTAFTVESGPERLKDEEDIENFAKTFKRRRKELAILLPQTRKAISKLQGKSMQTGSR